MGEFWTEFPTFVGNRLCVQDDERMKQVEVTLSDLHAYGALLGFSKNGPSCYRKKVPVVISSGLWKKNKMEKTA